jgi:hypothetical protein
MTRDGQTARDYGYKPVKEPAVDYVGPQAVSLKVHRPHNRRVLVGELPLDVLPLIAVDPGGVTGWSLLVLKRKVLGQDVFSHPLEMILRTKVQWSHGQINCKDDEDYGIFQLRKVIDEWPSAAIVFESFYVRQMGADLSPVRVTSVVHHHLWHHGREMVMQQPSMAKRISNDRLKALGCYSSRGGLEHARDADRHIIMFLRRILDNGEALKSVAWPHIYQNLKRA